MTVNQILIIFFITLGLIKFQAINSDETKEDIQKSRDNTQSWNLDPLANWLTTTNNGLLESRTFDATNAVTNRIIGANSEPITHDLDGNLKTDSKFRYIFDALNRLIEVRNPDQSLVVRYQVGAMNRRTAKIIGNTTTISIYNGWQVAEEKEVVQLKKQSKITLHAYAYGQYIDEPLMMATTQPNGNKKQIWYLHNQQFSVYALLNDNGKVIESYHYSAYGHPLIDDASGNAITVSNHDNTYMYTGRNLDAETGLHYFRNRYYSDAQGNFVSRDPLGYVNGLSLIKGYFVLKGLDFLGLATKNVSVSVNESTFFSGVVEISALTATFDYDCDANGAPFMSNDKTNVKIDYGGSSKGTITSVLSNPDTLTIKWAGAKASEGASTVSQTISNGTTNVMTGTAIVGVGVTGTLLATGWTIPNPITTGPATIGAGVAFGLTGAALTAEGTVGFALQGLSKIGESLLDNVWASEPTGEWKVTCLCTSVFGETPKKFVPLISGSVQKGFTTNDSDFSSSNSN